MKLVRQRVAKTSLSCFVHGRDSEGWGRAEGGYVCSLCHPNPNRPEAGPEPAVPPQIASGIRVVKWEPKKPPVAIVHVGVVTCTQRFITTTLAALEARLNGQDWLAGNRSVRELVERLEQVGVKIEVTKKKTIR